MRIRVEYVGKTTICPVRKRNNEIRSQNMCLVRIRLETLKITLNRVQLSGFI